MTKKLKRKSTQKEPTVHDKAKIAKELEYLKNVMKEHFKFFDNNSPQLKKKRKGGSHSPQKKTNHNKSTKSISKSKGK